MAQSAAAAVRIAYAAAVDLLYTAHVPSGEGPHPTLLMLHGWGASAHDLIGLAPAVHGGNALILCPQGSLAFQAGPGMVGYGWFPLSQEQPPEVQEVNARRGCRSSSRTRSPGSPPTPSCRPW